MALPVQADDYEQRRSYDMFFLDAMLQRTKGNHDAAFNLLTHCLEIDSTASEAYYFLAQYLGEMKQTDRALAYLKKALQLEPDNPDYMEILAQAYVSKEQYAEAAAVVEQLYERMKSRQDLLEMLYNLQLQQHDYQKAIDVLNRIEGIDGKTERLSLMKSGLYLKLNDYDAGLREMSDLSKQYPNDLNYRTLYANTLLMCARNGHEEQREEARRLLDEVLAEEPNNYKAQVTLRSYYVEQGDTLKADSLTRAILLNPATESEDRVSLMRSEIGYSERHGGDSTHVLTLFREMLAQPQPDPTMAEFCAAYMDMKKMPRDSVSEKLELVLRLAPDNASARLQLVQYAWEADDNHRVVELCRAARQYNPDEMAFYYYQGMAYYRQDDFDHALESFQNGISVITEESNPAIASDFYAVMGDLLHQKGRQNEAFAAYDSCLQWKPDNIACLNNYAYYLSELGQQLDKAEEMSSKAIKAEPRNGTYLDTYAWILFMQKRYSEARIYIDQAVQNDTTHSSVILEHAGDIYALDGNIAQALLYWQQALDGDAKNKTLIRKIKRKKYIK
jgi:tetratricopeptide (TPR) repeat protein